MIRCATTGKRYIGSSVRVHQRWLGHRAALRKGTSVCRGLQNAWSKYGESAFTFEVLEECEPRREVLEAREQHYLDTLRPELNLVQSAKRHVSDEHIAKLVRINRARAASVTHCPRKHEYDEANTYINAKGKRICRACNAARVTAIYAAETPEQREVRREKWRGQYAKQKAKRAERAHAYYLAHKAEKQAYDRAYRLRNHAA